MKAIRFGLILMGLASQIALAGQDIAFAPAAVQRIDVHPQVRESNERLQESSVTRYPEYWHPIREETKPEPRTTWAQDGYLFRYSF